MLTDRALHAVRLVKQGMTWARASQIAGVAQSTIAKAIKKQLCPTCGQTIKQGHKP